MDMDLNIDIDIDTEKNINYVSILHIYSIIVEHCGGKNYFIRCRDGEEEEIAVLNVVLPEVPINENEEKQLIRKILGIQPDDIENVEWEI